jgi:hypothetical protein
MTQNNWQPIATVPKDGRWVILWCDFGTNQEPVIARWVDNPRPAGPFGKFMWRDYQDGAIAEQIPTDWMNIDPPR